MPITIPKEAPLDVLKMMIEFLNSGINTAKLSDDQVRQAAQITLDTLPFLKPKLAKDILPKPIGGERLTLLHLACEYIPDAVPLIVNTALATDPSGALLETLLTAEDDNGSSPIHVIKPNFSKTLSVILKVAEKIMRLRPGSPTNPHSLLHKTNNENNNILHHVLEGDHIRQEKKHETTLTILKEAMHTSPSKLLLAKNDIGDTAFSYIVEFVPNAIEEAFRACGFTFDNPTSFDYILLSQLLDSNSDSMTPLHHAASYNDNGKSAKIILTAAIMADPMGRLSRTLLNQRNVANQTPLEYARIKGSNSASYLKTTQAQVERIYGAAITAAQAEMDRIQKQRSAATASSGGSVGGESKDNPLPATASAAAAATSAGRPGGGSSAGSGSKKLKKPSTSVFGGKSKGRPKVTAEPVAEGPAKTKAPSLPTTKDAAAAKKLGCYDQ